MSPDKPIGPFVPLDLGTSSAPDDAAPADEPVISAELAARTMRVLATLTPREEEVLRNRFGIGKAADSGAAGETEVGQDFEVTRQRIREIEAKARAKLRQRSTAARTFTDSSDDESDSDSDADR